MEACEVGKVEIVEPMKKVLIVIARFEFGGIPTQALLWAKYLFAQDFHPVIAAPELKDTRYCEMLVDAGIEFTVLNVGSSRSGQITYFRDIVREINRIGPFAILPFNRILSYNFCLVWRISKASKCYFMERGSGEDTPTSILGRLTRRLALASASGLIYNSASAAAKSLFPNKTFVIKNKFNAPDRSSAPIEDINLPKDALMLLHIANFSTGKNYPLLLRNWRRIREKFPSAFLVIIGAELTNKKPEIARLIDQPQIIHLGIKKNVFAYVKRADVCLLASFGEGCPNVILEYIHFGKRICASDIPPMREVLAPENYEFLFNNTSDDEFVRRVEAAIMLDTTSASLIATANRAKLEREYTERNYSKIIQLLND